MDVDNTESLVKIFSALNSYRRFKSFLYLVNGYSPKEFGDLDSELDISRSSIQRYIDDFKERDLIRTHGKDYVVTEKGELVVQWIEDLDEELIRFKKQSVRQYVDDRTEEELEELRTLVNEEEKE